MDFRLSDEDVERIAEAVLRKQRGAAPKPGEPCRFDGDPKEFIAFLDRYLFRGKGNGNTSPPGDGDGGSAP